MERDARTTTTWVALLGIGLGLGLVAGGFRDGGGGGGALAKRANPVVYDDDFVTDRGWVGNVPNEIYVDTITQTIRWLADRNKEQYLGLPITPFAGDTTIEVVGQIDTAQNNCYLNVGLAESLVKGGPGQEPPGVYIVFDFFGGGCQNYFFQVRAEVVFTDGTGPSTFIGYECNGSNGNAIEIEEARPYRARLEVSDRLLLLTVRDAVTDDLLGAHATALTGPLPAYSHVLVGNYADNDWPKAEGSIDRIRITRP